MKSLRRMLIICVVLFLGLMFFLPSEKEGLAQASDGSGSLATMKITTDKITWQPLVSYARLVLTVAAPDGAILTKTFISNSIPSLSPGDLSGLPHPDGLFNYELRLTPLLDAETQAALSAASTDPKVRDQVLESLRASGKLPSVTVMEGAFTLSEGSFVVPTEKEGAANGAAPSSIDAPDDIVQADDVIVQGSLCVGLDCVDGESFGFDTIRLKENNDRLTFDDTSSSAGFPANDWTLVANDSNSGGASYFAIQDVTGNTFPFKVAAGAPNSALYVAPTGRIGLGTSTPGYALEMKKTGEDVVFAANRTDGATAMLSAGASNVRIGSVTNHDVQLVVNNQPVMTLTGLGNVTLQGALSEYSDVNAKENIAPVNKYEVLQRLNNVPIKTWNYRSDTTHTQHMGPMAQDFYAAYSLGADDRHIAALDENGVSLAAIQALTEITSDQKNRITALAADNTALQQQVAQLATDNTALAQKVDNLETRLAALEQAAGASQAKPVSGLTGWNLVFVLVLAAGLLQVAPAIYRHYRKVKLV